MYENFKKLTYSWEVPSIQESIKNNNVWQVSESFTWPDCDKIFFSVHMMDWFDDMKCGSIIKIKKEGILNPRLAVITIISGKLRETRVIENWTEEFSDTVETHNEFTHTREEKIDCIIQLESLDFYDNNALLTSLSAHKYLHSTQFSDVIIKVENEELSAHKIILALSSPVFERMLTTDMTEAREARITLREVDIVSVKQMLMFIYTGKIEQDNDVDVLLKMLACADIYQIDNLKIFCEHQLIQNFSCDNIVKVLVGTNNYEVPLLNKAGKIFIDCNKSRISFQQALSGALKSKVLNDFFSNHVKMMVDEL